jgi:hypothetical protein
METMNVQCGHCKQLLAVSTAVLGQQVRCPHCKQVILAPAPAPAAVAPAPVGDVPPPEFLVPIPPISQMEDIFAPPEANSDALFAGPQRGLVEMPPAPGSSPPLAEPSVLPGQMETTLTYHPPDRTEPSPTAVGEPDAAAFSLGTGGATASEPTAATLDQGLLAQSIPKPQIRPPSDKRGWVTALLIVPLISYSVLATIVIILLRINQQPAKNQIHPLEMFQDLEGETPGVKPGKKKVSVNFNGKQELDLPEKLRTRLGRTIRIGDLEVTPLSVEFRPIEFISPDTQPVASETDSLVLNLRVKNVSDGFAFHPLDPFFVRRWKEVKDHTKSDMPFTYLTVGNSRFFGGPITSAEREERHETIKGQILERELQPRETLETFICTSPDDPVKEAVQRATQPMLWRVQVRRGAVKTPNRGEVSAAAVVGVEFTRAEIRRGSGG